MKFPRPAEIPYQSKVANQVQLIGTIGVPVELQKVSNGFFAVSVLVQEKKKDTPKLWIPIIFQGDLAQTAFCHLKESNLVHVTGQLIGDVPSLTVKDPETSTPVQVLVHTLSFVQNTSQENEDVMLCEQDDVASDGSDGRKEPNNRNDSLWGDLVDNPQQWWDNRLEKRSQKSPDFKNKNTETVLWLDSAPSWVSAKLDSLVFSGRNSLTKDNGLTKDDSLTKKKNVAVSKKLEKGELWKNLVENPDRWWDNRSNKFNQKSPDFKNKDTGEGLWLDSSTPSWVLSKLPPLKSKQDVDSKQAAYPSGKQVTWKSTSK